MDKDLRRDLMSAFQEVIYGNTVDKLQAAIAMLKAQPHKTFVKRVDTFLQRQEEWVALFRADTATRGHNTNNFAEATSRVLKDIVLNRVEAFNVVALVGAVAVTWEKYFEGHILCHAYSRVATHHLAYKQLLSRLPAGTADTIIVVDNGHFVVPSTSSPQALTSAMRF